MKKCIFVMGLSVTLLMFVGVAIAAEEYVMKFSWADPLEPLEQFTTAYGIVMKEQIEKLSGGRIKVELYPAGQLADQRSSVQQVRKGTIEAANIASGVLASLYYEKLNIFDLPFMFSSREVARRLLDINNPFTRKLVDECVEKTGIRILFMAPFGFRNLTNNTRPVKSPADMKGLKIRTMEVVPHIKLMEALGANPVPIPFLELYTSLQTKVVDGQENPFSLIIGQKFYQVQKYLTVTGHVMGIGATIINDEWFQSLPDDLKLAVVEGERAAQQTYSGLGSILDSLGMENLKSFGMEVYTPTPEEMKQFRDAAVPPVKAWMEEQLGTEFVEEYLAAIKAVEDDIHQEMESLKR